MFEKFKRALKKLTSPVHNDEGVAQLANLALIAGIVVIFIVVVGFVGTIIYNALEINNTSPFYGAGSTITTYWPTLVLILIVTIIIAAVVVLLGLLMSLMGRGRMG